MHEKGFYKGLNEKDIFRKIKDEGFSPVKISDSPKYIYEEHTHPETKILAILEGSMEVKTRGKSLLLEKGDKLMIPGNTKHSAAIGDKGCVFFWSEKLIY